MNENENAQDTPEIENNQKTPAKENGAPEDTSEPENEESKYGGESFNEGTNFGGNWREVFADCMRTEESTEDGYPRNITNHSNNDVFSGTNRILKFAASNMNEGGASDSGPFGDNNSGLNKSPNQEGKGMPDRNIGPDDDPFNLKELIWASSNKKATRKRKKEGIKM
ncbi:hypothetical protein Hanom_Chr08g00691051 [Helianthus anomalus]